MINDDGSPTAHTRKLTPEEIEKALADGQDLYDRVYGAHQDEKAKRQAYEEEKARALGEHEADPWVAQSMKTSLRNISRRDLVFDNAYAPDADEISAGCLQRIASVLEGNWERDAATAKRLTQHAAHLERQLKIISTVCCALIGVVVGLGTLIVHLHNLMR
jgi:hypothetical protein